MNTLDSVNNLSREDVLSKMESFELLEHGLHKEKLVDYLNRVVGEALEENKELGVIAALNNADTDYVLLDILKSDPSKVFQGINIVSYAIGAEKRILYLPESLKEFAKELTTAALEYNTEIKNGIVDVRANRGCAVLHITTVADVADVFNNVYTSGVYVSVNGNAVKKVPYNTKISELIDINKAKAILAGYKYLLPEEAEMTIEEAEVSNGILKVLTDKECVVSETEKRLLECKKQSCGKCVFCREGLIQLQYMQKEITEGRGKSEYLDFTKEIGEAMRISTSCTMGQASAEIALSAVSKISEEYEAHIKKKNCPAGVCSSFVNIYIDPQLCDGCGECMDVCPKDCIEGKPKYIHMIDEFDCTKCGKCIEGCKAGAIIKTTGKLPKLPDRLIKVGKFRKR